MSRSGSEAPSRVDAGPIGSPVGTAELVRGAGEGDGSAWNALVDRFGPLLWWVARRHRLDADDTADVVQTTWLRCVEHLSALRDPERLGPWLVTTCQRESLRVLRGRSRCAPHDPADATSALAVAVDPEPDPCEQVARAQQAMLLREAIADLPDRQRVLLEQLLRDEDITYVDLADRLRMPVGSLGPIRRRALDRLQGDTRLRP